jgi:hypothetical protein
MKPQKAYILRTTDPRSRAYAQVCADSCDRVGLSWEYFEGYEGLTNRTVWEHFPVPGLRVGYRMNDPAACATAGHMAIWKRIWDNNECAVILEHDALMLHSIDIDIPDNVIVSLGYKFQDYENYDWKSAGPPTKIQIIRRFSGAHAYCINAKTAQTLFDEIKIRGIEVAIDNFYFMRINTPTCIASDVPLAVMLPTPAICWLRESTIWDEPSTLNYDVLEDFSQYYRQ